MYAEQKAAIRRSFAQIAPIAPVAAALFYSRLFELAPQSRALFGYGTDTPAMARQGAKLMQTLGVAVAHLDDLGRITPALEELARRHVSYGVEPADYDAVGAALLWTLAQGLGEGFTPEIEAAWAGLYGALAAAMRRAAYAEPAALATQPP